MEQLYNTNQHPVEASDINFKKLIVKYIPYWPVFLLFAVVGLAVAYLINTFKEPVYRVNSLLLIQEDRSISSLMGGTSNIIDRSNFYNEAGLLESFALIDSVLLNMEASVGYYEIGNMPGALPRKEIYRESPFMVSFNNDHPQPYGEKFRITIIDENWYEITGIKKSIGSIEKNQYFFGQHVEGSGYSFKINMRTPYNSREHGKRSYMFIIYDPATISESYREGLTVSPVRLESSIIKITFETTNLQRARDFVNLFTSTFIEQNLHRKNHTAQNTVKFIDNQIALTSGSLADTEGKLQNFREKQQLMDINLIATQVMTEIQALDKDRSIEEVKRRYYNFLLEYVSNTRDFSEVFGPSALGIEDPILANLLLELSKLHTERGRLLLNATERSPSVLEVDQNIQQVKATLEESIKSILAASNILMNDFNQRITRLEQRLNQLPQTERELVGLTRMYNITDATYNFLLEKQAEAGITLASNMPDHRIIDKARFEMIVAPKTYINYALGLFMGFFLPFTFLGIRNYLNNRIIDKEEVARALNFPLLGLIPRHKPLQKNENVDVVIFNNPYSSVSESFRTIRSNLNFFPERENNLIVVTSVRAGEGKTFTSLNLAAVLAMSGKPTLYIDSDIRKTRPNTFTKRMIDVGLSNYLVGRAGLVDVINPSDSNNNLFIMNSGIICPNPAELINSEAMSRMLKEELNDYEYIVLDTSPVGMVADAQSLMADARLNIFVLRHNFSYHSDLDFIRDYNKNAGLKNMVLIINDIKVTKKGYGAGYGYGYGLGYGDRYVKS